MKIGILTLPSIRNYGGILQAYALQVYLQRRGHEVWVLNRSRKIRLSLWRQGAGILKRAVLKYVFGKHVALTLEENRRQTEYLCRYTRCFVNHYIHLTSPAYSSDDLAKQVKEFRLDVLIVGSDQVWRPRYVASVSDFFLGFLPEKSPVKRIAYAASFGVDNWEFTEEQTQECQTLIKRFDAISVRENSGIELCKQFLGAKAVLLPDPTLLLTPENYLSLLKSEKENVEPQLFAYFLDPSFDKQKVADRIAEHKHLKVSSLYTRMEDMSLPLQERILPSVEEWLCCFRDASFVVTDSFHGCVFSILFNKPFVVYGNPGRGMARFHSLLGLFGLEDCLVKSSKELDESCLIRLFDWKRINWILDEKRELAATFFNLNI